MIVERIDPLSKWIELKAELDRFRKTVVKDALSRRRTVPFEKRHSEFLEKRRSEAFERRRAIENTSGLPAEGGPTNFRPANGMREIRRGANNHLNAEILKWLSADGGPKRLKARCGYKQRISQQFWRTPQGMRVLMSGIAPGARQGGPAGWVMVRRDQMAQFERWFAATCGLGDALQTPPPLPALETGVSAASPRGAAKSVGTSAPPALRQRGRRPIKRERVKVAMIAAYSGRRGDLEQATQDVLLTEFGTSHTTIRAAKRLALAEIASKPRH